MNDYNPQPAYGQYPYHHPQPAPGQNPGGFAVTQQATAHPPVYPQYAGQGAPPSSSTGYNPQPQQTDPASWSHQAGPTSYPPQGYPVSPPAAASPQPNYLASHPQPSQPSQPVSLGVQQQVLGPNPQYPATTQQPSCGFNPQPNDQHPTSASASQPPALHPYEYKSQLYPGGPPALQNTASTTYPTNAASTVRETAAQDSAQPFNPTAQPGTTESASSNSDAQIPQSAVQAPIAARIYSPGQPHQANTAPAPNYYGKNLAIGNLCRQ